MSDVELFKELKELLISQQHSPEDIAQVEKAYKFAKKHTKVNLGYQVNRILYTLLRLQKYLQG